MSEQHKVRDKSRDAKYFTINPRIVKYYSRTPYDYALWDTIKEVAGDSSECYLSTEDLAFLSGMSVGKVVDCRDYWISIGFLEGEVRRDPGYPQPVWHLSIPDLWSKNIAWAESHLSIKDRIEFKKSLHVMKPSPGEGGYSPHEGGYSPGEAKNKEKEIKKDNKPFKIDREAALQRKAEQRAKRKDPMDWVQEHAQEIQILHEMRLRVEAALGMNLEREWDLPASDWHDYDKTLIKREVETGQTIEGFMEWWDQDDFRRDNQRIWLKPGKIEQFWRQAYPVNNPNNQLVDPETGWAPFDFGDGVRT